MKKITRKSFQELRRQFPVLTGLEMRCCIGGNTSWDCLFRCMNYMDPSRSTQDYYDEFVDRYNMDPSGGGGVPSNYNSDALASLGFSNVESNSITNNGTYHQVVILDNGDGTSHAVIALSTPGQDGTFSYYDPTEQQPRSANKSKIISVYAIKKSDIGDSSSDGITGYGGYPGYDNDDYNHSNYNDSGFNNNESYYGNSHNGYSYNNYHNSDYGYNNYENYISYSNNNYNNQYGY